MDRATIFMTTGWIGLASLAMALVGAALPWAETLGTIAALICILCCWVLLSTRNADEYTRGLWTSAASLAFAGLLVMMIGWPFLEGLLAGLTGNEKGKPSYEGIFVCAIIAFYIGLFWQRFRGA